MDPAARHTDPERWIAAIFSAQAVARGGVVRRSVNRVQREIGLQRFEREVRARGFHMLESGGQLIVICNRGGVRVIC